MNQSASNSRAKQRAQESNRPEKERSFSFPFLALLLVVLMLLMMNTGCSPLLGASATVGELPAGATLFLDDFSKTPSGWGIWNREGASVKYDQGGLRIQVAESQYDFWSVAGKTFQDVQIEADASSLGGPTDNDFGLICRYQNKDNFYMLVVSSDGYYGIARMKNGQYGMIGSDQLQYSDAIHQGQATNHLRADCIGSKLSLYANGQKLMEASDESFSAGDVGVLAGAYNQEGVDILFDNFVVKKP